MDEHSNAILAQRAILTFENVGNKNTKRGGATITGVMTLCGAALGPILVCKRALLPSLKLGMGFPAKASSSCCCRGF